MTTISANCRQCQSVIELTPEQVLLRRSPVGGSCLYACPTCGEVADVPVLGAELRLLRAAGVVTYDNTPPAAPAFTEADLHTLQRLLESPDWFERLVHVPGQ